MTEQPESPNLASPSPAGPPAGPPPSNPYAYPPAPPGTPSYQDYPGYQTYPGYQPYQGYQGYQGAYPGPYPQPAPYGDPYAGIPATKRNGLGTGALILGILAVVPGTCTVVLGVILGVVAVILGVLGRKRVSRGEADNGGTALAGILLGVLAIVASVALAVIATPLFKEVGFSEYVDCMSNAAGDQVEQDLCTAELQERIEGLQGSTARR
jgi:hypothetical protein